MRLIIAAILVFYISSISSQTFNTDAEWTNPDVVTQYKCLPGYVLKGSQCYNVMCYDNVVTTPPPTIATNCVINAIPAVTQYTCPPYYELRGNQCYNTYCNQTKCIVPPIVVVGEGVKDCPTNSYRNRYDECVYIDVIIVCPTGTRLEGNTCIYDVPGNFDVTIEVRCPLGIPKSNNKCIYTAQELIFACPPNTERRGDVCVLNPITVIFMCADGSMPDNGICTIRPTGLVTFTCPPGSVKVSDNECRVTPPEVRSLCPDGSSPDYNNICYVQPPFVKPPPVEFVCPEGAIINEYGQCVIYIDEGQRPSIDFICPNGADRVGSTCIIQVKETQKPDFKYICPLNSMQENQNTCVYNIPEVFVINEINCPVGMDNVGNKCVHHVRSDSCVETVKNIASNCSVDKTEHHECGKPVENSNHINAPVHTPITNINNINITTSECGHGQKESVITQNGVTRHIPCSRPAPQPSPSCCTVQTPPICSVSQGQWNCNHRQHRRCGSFCNQDFVQLRPQRSMYQSGMLVMMPQPIPMQSHRTNSHTNCYGCLSGDFNNCSPDCYSYDCGSGGSCGNYMDQSQFCEEYGGAGCDTLDGYFY